MNALKVNKIDYPTPTDYEDHALDEYDFEHIPDTYDECWYFYGTGYYCGNGEMILRRGQMFYRYNLGHCSCYGPCEDIAKALNGVEGKSFSDLVGKMTPSCRGNLEPLFVAIRASEWGQKYL